MQLEDKQVNVLFLPVINQMLPEGVRLQHIACKENGMEWDIAGPGIEETVGRKYWVEVRDFSFDDTDKFALFHYEKAELPFGLEDAPGPGLFEWIPTNDVFEVGEEQIKVQLNEMTENYPTLNKLIIKELTFHEGFLQVILDTDQKELVTIQMNSEHRRFYDNLRMKIEEFMKEKMGDRQSEKWIPYLLLAPDLFVLLARLIKDRRVEVQSKAILMVAILYFMTPVDIIPEAVVGPIGFIDDIVLAVFALKKIIGDVEESILLEHWNGKQNLLHVIQDVVDKADDLVGSKRLAKINRYLRKNAR